MEKTDITEYHNCDVCEINYNSQSRYNSNINPAPYCSIPQKQSKVNTGGAYKMKKLSLSEFKRTCTTISPTQFIFSSENQVQKGEANNVKVRLIFSAIHIAFNPNIICFKNSNNDYLCLSRVKGVEMESEKSLLGTVFNVICGNLYNDFNDSVYTILAR